MISGEDGQMMQWRNWRAGLVTIALLSGHAPVAAQQQPGWRDALIADIEALRSVDDANALQIGRWAEIGYQEHRSSALLQERLAKAGFKITAPVAGMPTAFVASYGEGKPVIGILAEFDALPGLSQAGVPIKQAIDGQAAGHACGHNLLGAGAVLAAVAVRNWLAANKGRGTIRVYGTPAEEGGGGKTYLVRDGVLDDVDVMMNWHPDSYNAAVTKSNLAMITGKFRFHGYATHASAAPERGRSALDGVEAMNVMANMMREHIGEKSRIHYAITRTNPAPNIVPDFAEVYYFVRDPDAQEAQRLWDRIVKASEGAALGTGTTVDHEVLTGHYGYLPNTRLSQISHDNLQRVGGVIYDAQEMAFAQTLIQSFQQPVPKIDRAREIQPVELNPTDIWTGSSDVGDVSWTVPTNWIRTATYVPGTSGHSWQATAASNMSIGLKGMHVAAKAMALTMVDLMLSPELVAEVKAEFVERRGTGYRYVSLVGDRNPPLDYMK